jgi:hypothetical protein
VQVAFGPSACHLASHWLNLQGLAATTTGQQQRDGDAAAAAVVALCSAPVMHSVYRETYVPRAILVDYPYHPQQQQAPSLLATAGGGGGQPLQPLGQERQEGEGDLRPHYQPQQQHHKASVSYEEFTRLAASLAFHPNSRYHVPSHKTQHQSTSSSAFAPTGRQVNWDEEEEEEEDDEDRTRNDENEDRRRHEAWKREFTAAQETLDRFWEQESSSSPIEEGPTAEVGTQPPSGRDWRTMLMHPYRPDGTILTAPRMSLGTGHGAGANPVVETYTSGQTPDVTSWMETTVWETARQRLEECDSCQGLILGHSGAVFAGWATSFLREWNDECPHKSCLVVATSSSEMSLTGGGNNNGWDEKRHILQHLLALDDHNDLADAVLPCHVGGDDVVSAEAACALEAATLPFRLQPSSSKSRARTLLSSATLNQDDFTGTLSFREFLRTLLRQSASRNLLHLSSYRPGPTNEDNLLQTALLQGTSIQRDYRMRQPGYAGGGIHRGPDELPGKWLSETTVGGLMSNWLPNTPIHGPVGDRSLHYNFASSAALRMSATVNGIDDYATGLLESMAIRYRPAQAMATVVNESLSDITCNGYAAGSYWATHQRRRAATVQLATLDNSSRVYPYLHHLVTATERIMAPGSRRSLDRSRYNQDLALGLVPELDDAKDATTSIMDLHDCYTPPESSGLVFDNDADDIVNGQF